MSKLSLAIACMTLLLTPLAGQKMSPTPVAKLPGSSLRWIHIAEVEFAKEKLNPDRYTVVVFEDQETVTVVLDSSNGDYHIRGDAGPYPGYEVEISKRDSKIVRSNYIR